VCTDGPVFSYAELEALEDAFGSEGIGGGVAEDGGRDLCRDDEERGAWRYSPGDDRQPRR
jgi:hypothetical protein